MSLMRLLAAGRSIMGIKREPGPYRMNQEHLLPRFAPRLPAAVVTAGPTAAQTESTLDDGAAVSTPPLPTPKAERTNRRTAGRPVGNLMRNVFCRLTLRRGAVGVPRGPKTSPRPIQTELSLDTVKVVRNDLSDSDFELKSAQAKGAGQPLGMVWNRLSARLLRQAAQEFNVVQKERGKLLSQAGPASGGPRSP